jgi:chemotaxis protein MotB
MALFIVLWIINSSQKVRESVSGYFRDPRGYTTRLGAGPAGEGEGLPLDSRRQDLERQIQQALRRMPDYDRIRNQVKFSVTGEGLRIDLMENEQGMFFVTGSPTPTADGERLLSVLAAEISRLPNGVVIEGHTDGVPFHGALPSRGYSNWELSADRANAARRLLHSSGLRAQQVVEVRGFADQRLLMTEAPDDPRNRRISLVVKFTGE